MIECHGRDVLCSPFCMGSSDVYLFAAFHRAHDFYEFPPPTSGGPIEAECL
jgi:hypothetical protein